MSDQRDPGDETRHTGPMILTDIQASYVMDSAAFWRHWAQFWAAGWDRMAEIAGAEARRADALTEVVTEELAELREREWSFLGLEEAARKERRECPHCYSWEARGHRDGCEIARRIAQIEAVLRAGPGG